MDKTTQGLVRGYLAKAEEKLGVASGLVALFGLHFVKTGRIEKK